MSSTRVLRWTRPGSKRVGTWSEARPGSGSVPSCLFERTLPWNTILELTQVMQAHAWARLAVGKPALGDGVYTRLAAWASAYLNVHGERDRRQSDGARDIEAGREPPQGPLAPSRPLEPPTQTLP